MAAVIMFLNGAPIISWHVQIFAFRCANSVADLRLRHAAIERFPTKAQEMPYFVVTRERGEAWDWSARMREQPEWDAHAAFMDALANEGFIAAGGPLGSEDEARRVLHVVYAPPGAGKSEIEAKMASDPWISMGLLRPVSVEPWTVLLGGFDCPTCGMLTHAPKKGSQ